MVPETRAIGRSRRIRTKEEEKNKGGGKKEEKNNRVGKHCQRHNGPRVLSP